MSGTRIVTAALLSLAMGIGSAAFAAGGGGGGGGGSGGGGGGSGGGGGHGGGGGSGADGGGSGAGGSGSGSGSGGGGSSGGMGGGFRQDMTTCPKGRVWDTGRRTCGVRSSELPDGMLTDYAFALAKADRYEEAIEVLDTLADPNTPKALNYRGYATRHLGRTEEGIGYYLHSVSLDPSYVQVREYLGEAYIIQGRIDLAREQLATIQSLCGGPCEEAEDLEEMISTGKVED